MDTVESIEQDVLTESEVEGVQEEQPRARLANLMQKMIKRRENVRAAQQKLRDIEMELRQAKTEKRSRFERMREGALQEYRNARAEFARARMQLHSSLRMLPSRS
jgi:hypothetical protein